MNIMGPLGSFHTFLLEAKPKMTCKYPFLSQDQILSRLRLQWKKINKSRQKTIKAEIKQPTKISKPTRGKFCTENNDQRMSLHKDRSRSAESGIDTDENEQLSFTQEEPSPYMRNKTLIDNLNAEFYHETGFNKGNSKCPAMENEKTHRGSIHPAKQNKTSGSRSRKRKPIKQKKDPVADFRKYKTDDFHDNYHNLPSATPKKAKKKTKRRMKAKSMDDSQIYDFDAFNQIKTIGIACKKQDESSSTKTSQIKPSRQTEMCESEIEDSEGPTWEDDYDEEDSVLIHRNYNCSSENDAEEETDLRTKSDKQQDQKLDKVRELDLCQQQKKKVSHQNKNKTSRVNWDKPDTLAMNVGLHKVARQRKKGGKPKCENDHSISDQASVSSRNRNGPATRKLKQRKSDSQFHWDDDDCDSDQKSVMKENLQSLESPIINSLYVDRSFNNTPQTEDRKDENRTTYAHDLNALSDSNIETESLVSSNVSISLCDGQSQSHRKGSFENRSPDFKNMSPERLSDEKEPLSCDWMDELREFDSSPFIMVEQGHAKDDSSSITSPISETKAYEKPDGHSFSKRDPHTGSPPNQRLAEDDQLKDVQFGELFSDPPSSTEPVDPVTPSARKVSTNLRKGGRFYSWQSWYQEEDNESIFL